MRHERPEQEKGEKVKEKKQTKEFLENPKLPLSCWLNVTKTAKLQDDYRNKILAQFGSTSDLFLNNPHTPSLD